MVRGGCETCLISLGAGRAVSRVLTTVLVVALAAVAISLARGRPAPEPGRPAPSERLAPAPGMFLVARRHMPDPNFRRSVVLLLQHDENGTVGLIVNRPTNFRLQDALPDLPGVEAADHPLFLGGPVARTLLAMLLRNEGPSQTVERITDEVSFSADRDVLERLIARKKPAEEMRLYLGHAGWGAGQLVRELARGDWHLAKADAASIFGGEEGLWDRLIEVVDPPGIEIRREQEFRRAAIGAVASTLWRPTGRPFIAQIASARCFLAVGETFHISKRRAPTAINTRLIIVDGWSHTRREDAQAIPINADLSWSERRNVAGLCRSG